MKASPYIFRWKALLIVLGTVLPRDMQACSLWDRIFGYYEDLSALRPSFGKARKHSRQPKAPHLQAHQDITQALNQHIAQDTLQHKAQNQLSIYTIQAYTGSSRQEATQMRARILSHFPHLPPTLGYQSPYYTVHIGTYIDKIEAYAVYYALRKAIPSCMLRRMVIPHSAYQDVSP